MHDQTLPIQATRRSSSAKGTQKKNQNLKHTNFPGKENHQNVSTKQATLTFADLQAITFGDKRGRIPPFQNNAHIRAKT